MRTTCPIGTFLLETQLYLITTLHNFFPNPPGMFLLSHSYAALLPSMYFSYSPQYYFSTHVFLYPCMYDKLLDIPPPFTLYTSRILAVHSTWWNKVVLSLHSSIHYSHICTSISLDLSSCTTMHELMLYRHLQESLTTLSSSNVLLTFQQLLHISSQSFHYPHRHSDPPPLYQPLIATKTPDTCIRLICSTLTSHCLVHFSAEPPKICIFIYHCIRLILLPLIFFTI